MPQRNSPKFVADAEAHGKADRADDEHREDIAHEVGCRPAGQHGRARHGQGAEALDQPLWRSSASPTAVLTAPKVTVCT